MPLSKKQIAQRKNFKNRSNNSSTGQFEESKLSDSSDSDFILSDEIYSSDSNFSDLSLSLMGDIEKIIKNNSNFGMIQPGGGKFNEGVYTLFP
ncbi:4313_t:CDS:2 [Entrophospora sp. SA101]|nr:4313_t:CDS:2 [Entrophospora sp. SA101]